VSKDRDAVRPREWTNSPRLAIYCAAINCFV
jgi:hypothetical protein